MKYNPYGTLISFIVIYFKYIILDFRNQYIQAIPTSAASDANGFKAQTVFKEIEKKLQQVRQMRS